MRLLVILGWFSSIGLLAGCGESDSMTVAGTGGGANVAGNSSTAGTSGDTGGNSAVGGNSSNAGATSTAGPWKGINLSSAEWGNTRLPGTYGTDYTYPTHAEVDRYTNLGMNIFRLPFRWERLQRSLSGSLDATEQGRLSDFVNYATGKGAHVIVEPHNFAQYNGQTIGAGAVTDAAFSDFWSKVANVYKGNSLVIFCLMNEPHDINVNTWLSAANAAIGAIRAAGATNLIMVPGTNWTGAFSWTTSTGANDNRAMLGVVDSGNNYVYEVHQYLDSDRSGTHDTCISSTVGVESVQAFDGWLQQNGKRAFLGEFGGGPNQTCLSAMDGMLTFIEANPNRWLGWAYWAGGPWWSTNSDMIITDTQTPAQLTLLESHL